MGQGSAPEQSGGASVTRLTRWTGLHVTEERVPRLGKGRNPPSTWIKRVPAVTDGVRDDRRQIHAASRINESYLHWGEEPG